MTAQERDQEIKGFKEKILELQKEVERHEKLRDKMEDNGNYDSTIYDKIDSLYRDITYNEKQIEYIERDYYEVE